MTPSTRPGSGWMERFASGWMQSAADRPRAALGVLLMLCLLAFAGASGLGVNADSSRMLSPDLPDQRRALELAEAFPDLKRNVVIVVRSEQSDAADLVVADLVGRLQMLDGIAQVYSPAADPFMLSHGLLYRKTEEVEAAMARLSASSNLLAALREDQTTDGFMRAMGEARTLAERAELGPESLDRLFGETAAVLRGQLGGTPRDFAWSSILADESEAARATRLITVTPQLDLTRLSPAKPALQAIDAAIAALPPDLAAQAEIGVTGEPALRAEEMQSVLGTIGISLALSLVLVAAILWIGLKSPGRALLAFGSLLVTLILTTGFAGVMVGELNLISVAFIVLMVGLGIDFAIHILGHVVELRQHGTPAAQTPGITGQRMGIALMLSAATTSLAFLAFATTDFLGMAQLGLIGGGGVLIACAVAMTLIPAVIALVPGLAGAPVAKGAAPSPARRFHPMLAPTLIAVLGIAAIWPALSVRFEADPIGLRDPEASSVRAFNLLARDAETTPYRVSVLARDAAEAEAIADRFANREGIGGAIWLGDLIPQEQDDKLEMLDFAYPSIEFAIVGTAPQVLARGDAQTDTMIAFRDALVDWNKVDATEGASALAEALSAYLAVRTPGRDAALEQALFRSFPLLIDRLAAMLEMIEVDADTLPAALRDRFVNPDGLHRVEILPEGDLRDPRTLETFARTVQSIEAKAAGGPIQMTAAADTVGQAMVQATLLAALATGLLAWIATRRWWDAVAILGPLAVAAILTAAASTILDLPFNYANVIVLPLLIGIGVDSGIHVALRERAAPGAVFATSTPRAVLFSAVTTMAAFGTLALSDHRGTASMGMLLAIAMCAAVACVMALTPTVIRWTRPRT